MFKDHYSTTCSQFFNHFSLGSQLGSIQSDMLPVPVIPCFASTSLSSEPSFQFKNQFLATDSENQVRLSHDKQILQDLLRPKSDQLSHTYNVCTISKIKNDTGTLSMVGHELSSALEEKGSSSRCLAMPQYLDSQETSFQHHCGDSGLASLIGFNTSPENTSNVVRYELGKHFQQRFGLDTTCYSGTSSVVEDNLSDFMSLPDDCSFFSNVPETATSGSDMLLSGSKTIHNLLQSDILFQQMKRNHLSASRNDSIPYISTMPSCIRQSSNDLSVIPAMQVSSRPLDLGTDSPAAACDDKTNSECDKQLLSNIDLFDSVELDFRQLLQGQGLWDDMFVPVENKDDQNMSINISEHTSELEKDATLGNEEGFFSEFGLRHILDSIGDGKADSSTSHSSVTTCLRSTNVRGSENLFSASSHFENTPSGNKIQQMFHTCFSESPGLFLPRVNVEIKQETTEQTLKSKVVSWVDDTYSMNAKNAFINKPKKPDESNKTPKKRARPGESSRPRPKDRQQIQDRVKELREIVPNGAKCSIDALLARTVNHMRFLQGIIKYADKIKEADEPKMIGDASGVILRDSSSDGGGTTWAYELAGQTIICPITIKELNPPGQMLIEILCEERGSFLEIADSIRGFGLTILKGVMESKEKKIWAHFLVEANQEATRMEIFLHLVQLLSRTSGNNAPNNFSTKVIEGGLPAFNNYRHSPVPISISLAEQRW